jgi:hypothetical protein
VAVGEWDELLFGERIPDEERMVFVGGKEEAAGAGEGNRADVLAGLEILADFADGPQVVQADGAVVIATCECGCANILKTGKLPSGHELDGVDEVLAFVEDAQTGVLLSDVPNADGCIPRTTGNYVPIIFADVETHDLGLVVHKLPSTAAGLADVPKQKSGIVGARDEVIFVEEAATCDESSMFR